MESKAISKFKTVLNKHRKLTIKPTEGLECGSETLPKPFLLQPQFCPAIFGETLLFSDNMIYT
jgi:hypothetical protein